MKCTVFLKANVLAIVAFTATLSFLMLKVSGLDVKQKRMTVSVSFYENPYNPADVADENRWSITPINLPINGLIKKPTCSWLKIRI